MVLLKYTETIDETFQQPNTLTEAQFTPVFFTRKRKMPFKDLL